MSKGERLMLQVVVRLLFRIALKLGMSVEQEQDMRDRADDQMIEDGNR